MSKVYNIDHYFIDDSRAIKNIFNKFILGKMKFPVFSQIFLLILKFPVFSLILSQIFKFPDFSLQGICIAMFPVSLFFPSVGTLSKRCC